MIGNILKYIKRILPSLLCLSFLIPEIVLARTFKVNSVEDVNDLTPGNGLCVAYLIVIPPFVLPFCSLRGAVEESNNLPGKDIVVLPSGLLRLSLPGVDEDSSLTGDLDIMESLTIQGQGPDKTIIDGKSLDRIIDVISANVVVTIEDVTLLNGKVTSGNDSLHGGGAIRNRGSLKLNNVVLLNHKAEGGGVKDLGGILLNVGQSQIVNSTLQGGKAHEGGGIYNLSGGELTLISSTVSNNNALVGAGASNYGKISITNATFSENGNSQTISGGGLENRNFASLQHVTFAYNWADNGGGIRSNKLLNIQNSIIGENFGEDCHGARYINSLGNNLDSDNSCILNQDSDISGAEPQLLPLKNNGGTTQTHRLRPQSPARDNGHFIANVISDQRGVKRPQGKMVDIGAVENEVFALPPLISPILNK